MSFVLLGAAATTAAAQPVEKGSLGAGIIIGEPTGVCAKLYLQEFDEMWIASVPKY